jgi:hypothetical protein
LRLFDFATDASKGLEKPVFLNASQIEFDFPSRKRVFDGDSVTDWRSAIETGD